MKRSGFDRSAFRLFSLIASKLLLRPKCSHHNFGVTYEADSFDPHNGHDQQFAVLSILRTVVRTDPEMKVQPACRSWTARTHRMLNWNRRDFIVAPLTAEDVAIRYPDDSAS